MDISDWTVADLRMYLEHSVGLESSEVSVMNETDLRALVASIVGDDNHMPATETATHGIVRSDEHQSTSMDVAATTATSTSVNVDNRGGYTTDLTTTHDDMMSISNGHDLESRDQMLTNFCEMTGVEITVALQILEACSWDINTAVSMHMEEEQHSSAPVASSSFPARHVSSRTAEDTFMNYERHLNASMRARRHQNDPGAAAHGVHGVDGAQYMGPMGAGFIAAMAGQHFGGYGFAEDEDEMALAGGHNSSEPYNEYEAGVRRPDPVRVGRLIGGGARGGDFSRADDPSVEWLFPPPRHMSFPGTFQEARTMAKTEKKWVLANIQSHQEFGSHQLNRDTWVDETVVEIMREHMVFWQRGHTSQDAQGYMNLYGLHDTDLPHIGIIDPRTGAKISSIMGYTEPRVLTQMLFEFFDENSFDSVKAPKERHRANTITDTIYIDNDDDKEDEKGSQSLESRKENKVVQKHSEDDAVEVREAKKARDDSADVKAEYNEKAEEAPAVTSPTVDYGPVPDEPSDKEPDAVRVSIKLANGKGLVRRYRKSDPVGALFAVVRSIVPEAGEPGKSFEISTTYPKTALSQRLHDTIESAGLAASSVVMSWL